MLVPEENPVAKSDGAPSMKRKRSDDISILDSKNSQGHQSFKPDTGNSQVKHLDLYAMTRKFCLNPKRL